MSLTSQSVSWEHGACVEPHAGLCSCLYSNRPPSTLGYNVKRHFQRTGKPGIPRQAGDLRNYVIEGASQKRIHHEPAISNRSAVFPKLRTFLKETHPRTAVLDLSPKCHLA